ncbi:hypothetical protein [Polyangium aurulentum]|uniref:hypothetical protein n=1 Tax=Polyangium aurulentum TaxID=2567896 RepID=UPI0010AE6B03|nr:hypothetical protein [Polyangium aurulentum]UQA59127.1 hypothetical protein E8A73_001000 [Polyangium aurulentum]
MRIPHLANSFSRFFPTLIGALAVAASLALAGVGCGGEEPNEGDPNCYDYSSFNADAPQVSFKTDVLPIFRNSCGLSSACHGGNPGPAGQPYLGPAAAAPDPDQTEIDAIIAANVDVDATKAPTMKNVAPGSPENSFLMHKMDGTLQCASVKCDPVCGASMPQGSGVLPQDKRDTVRRWIAQGAKNN